MKQEEVRELIYYVGKGLNNIQIADKMNYSEGFIKKTLKRLYKKYDVHTRASLVFEYLRPKFVDVGFWNKDGGYIEDWQMVTKEEI